MIECWSIVAASIGIDPNSLPTTTTLVDSFDALINLVLQRIGVPCKYIDAILTSEIDYTCEKESLTTC